MATMVLGGLWHGAAWTFVVWGTLHGLFLVVNHFWRDRIAAPRGWGTGRAYRAGAWLVTFAVVVVAWVFFRAPDLATAFDLLRAMFGAGEAASSSFRLSYHRDQLYLTIALLAIALAAPNTQELMRRFEPALGPLRATASRLAWRPTLGWLAATCALVAWAIALTPQGDRVSEFLYFQF